MKSFILQIYILSARPDLHKIYFLEIKYMVLAEIVLFILNINYFCGNIYVENASARILRNSASLD